MRGLIFGLLVLLVLAASQTGYVCSWYCANGDDSYCGLFDKWKSVAWFIVSILTILCSVWYIKSPLPFAISTLFMLSTWNELSDELWGDPHKFLTEEKVFLVIILFVCTLLYRKYARSRP